MGDAIAEERPTPPPGLNEQQATNGAVAHSETEATATSAGAAASSAAAASSGANLSATAPTFIPSTVAAKVVPQGDMLSRLPLSHKSLLRGCYQAMSGEWIAYYVGSLKSFNSRNGFGFLECIQATADWGQDVFIHKNYVPNPWNCGQPVEFAVTVNNRGQPQAVDVNWLPKLPSQHKAPAPGQRLTPVTALRPPVLQAAAAALPAPSAPKPAPGLETAAPRPPAQQQQQQQAAAAAAATAAAAAAAAAVAQPEKRYLGTLKSYSPAQGYGFIASEEVMSLHGRDVYLDKSQLQKDQRWKFGQTIEFAITMNVKGQPQARAVDWDPVPHTELREAPDAAAGGTQASRSYSAKTTENLTKLLRLISSRQLESAVVTAIDLQGGGANGGQNLPTPDVDNDVDYVSFVMDRLGSEAETARTMKDFVKMLLLLMLAKMLRMQPKLPRCQQIIRWFEVFSHTISVTNESVRSHFQDVVEQINNNLQHAIRENKILVDQVMQSSIQSAFQRLQEKAANIYPIEMHHGRGGN